MKTLDSYVLKLLESNPKEVGALIRRLRTEKGLRLADLGDEQVSSSTLSNIERGIGKHKVDRVVYILEKLGVPMDNIADVLDQERNSIALIDFKLKSAEAFLKLRQSKEALQELEKVKIHDFHYLTPKYYYLKGRCLQVLNEWDQAEKFFLHAIELLIDVAKDDNIEAACYGELALCKHRQNDLHQALELTDKGILSFVEGGDRQNTIYTLYLNKSIFCNKLSLPDGILSLKQLEILLDQIEDPNIRLKYYWLKADYTRKYGNFKESMQYAEEGLELAGMCQLFHLFMEFWLCIGDCLSCMGKFREAEDQFKQALQFNQNLVGTTALISANLRIGTLYSNNKLWEKAEPFAITARNLSIEQNNAPNLFSTLLLLGDIERGKGNHTASVQFYQQAQEVAHKYNYTELEIQAWTCLALCWENVDQEQFQLCASYVFKLKNSTI
ncbi:tetratricopeptide (TPR) repeat protein [Croceifilum oryzae]|uniref:Tetratricopeptide (TPR) repeat protein n=1 Tax=Croceifilum oryzae TaxID=1553429 RepID=A0AAJ1TL23_9BACL|nr:helix-turn-helix domain-containing protein [Croceifilum oryzae]MDQ0418852.1 tetratricopeptide (TPR) repeat protein [Croceifilum oryzae]